MIFLTSLWASGVNAWISSTVKGGSGRDMTNHGSWRPTCLTPFLRHVHSSAFVRSVFHKQDFSLKPQILDTAAELPLDIKDILVFPPRERLLIPLGCSPL